MNQRSKFLQFAISQIGMKGGNTVRKWYNENVANIGNYNWPWCAAGISYCAGKTGISRDIITPTASSSTMLNNFKKAGAFKNRGTYTPKGGDIIIFKWLYNTSTPASHVGIVEYAKDGYVHTIEFNSGSSSDGQVARWKHKLTSETIVGYGVPKFVNTQTKVKKSGYIRMRAYLDPIYQTAKVLTKVKVGDLVEHIEDDMYGWSKVKINSIEGYIQNTRLDEKGLSKFPTAMIKKSAKLKMVRKNRTKLVPADKTVICICIIEQGTYKNKAIIRYKGKTYYTEASNLKNITKRK